MSGAVISIEHARHRPAARERAEHREAVRAHADERARQRWLADLKTWPLRFRRLIEPELLDPKVDLAAIAAARDGEQQWSSWIGAKTPAGEIAARLENYRYHIAKIRKQRSKGWRTQRRRLLRHQADRLVEALWMYGFRKVDSGMRAKGVRE